MNEKLRKILQRKKEIRAKLSANVEGTVELTDEEIAKLNGELDQLNQEEEAALKDDEENEERKKAEAITRVANGETKEITLRKIEKPGEKVEERNTELSHEERAKRGKALREKRAITIDNNKIVLAKHTANGVNDTFNEVSTLIDLVTVTTLDGGESYQRGYVKGYGEGGPTTNKKYKKVDTEFGYADINKQKITAYSEEPEEIKKLADADYHDKIVKGMTVAEKKKMSKSILIGDGSTGEFQGIFSNPTGEDVEFAIDKTKDLEIETIDDTTLDEIVYSYGGEEDTVADACLILNKKDLKAFAKVRNADGKKAYKIVNHGNTGTIDDIPYVINSACGVLSGKDTTKDTYCMAYGSLSNYEVALFSALEVKQSEDYKFEEGQIAHKGVVFAGGNVVAYNGFIRVKKAATQTEQNSANKNEQVPQEV